MFPRIATIKILLLSLTLLLEACSTGDVQDYIHEPTQELRQNIIHSGHQEIDGVDGRKFVVVPNFRTFTSSYSAKSARLIIVSKGATLIYVGTARLRNTDTGAIEAIEINQAYEVSKPVPNTDYYLGFVPLPTENFSDVGKFNQAKELELTVIYNLSSGKQVTETFHLKLATRKAAAWVT